MTRTADGPAGDAERGRADGAADGSSRHRRPEPVFERAIRVALGQADTVLYVGAGAVSYEPRDRDVTTVEPPAETLLFADGSFDAAASAFSLPAWPDLERGLAEVRRVTRGPVALLTRDPARIPDHWLADYAPEVLAREARRWPALDRVADALGGQVTTTRVPIPFTCVDGFSEAYYARPERLLDAGARRADPAWAAVDEMTAARSVAALRTALEDGTWDARYGRLRVQPSYEGSLVLVVGQP
ncbi:class I SAM-dependent methyltransferase [Curtobacterium herbarum]|uniref:class I SAM-dependent methyltransferase n=1 Tax=Curtobacterium herbarum TaxID=150122 RepID=UPI0019572D7C|nr:methyltransferase domain-containing protein [Curtobacterium herbarum]MBM7473894.1 SAM-dependent methyltransferase [Curtobacterium herbarum]MCS6544778.1 class I SAM-dependent methyltransferase [Curtobacterium herbarum]